MIYSIEINEPDDLIIYIIDQYETLNYTIERNIFSYVKNKNPLIAAINVGKFTTTYWRKEQNLITVLTVIL